MARVWSRTETTMLWLARFLWLACLFLAAAAISVAFSFRAELAATAAPELAVLAGLCIALTSMTYATAGFLILRQLVRHAIGWLLLLAGLAIALVFVSLWMALVLTSSGDPLGPWFGWVATYAWWPMILLAVPVIAPIFPDGRFLGPRWRLLIGTCLVVIAIDVALASIQPGPMGTGSPPNPLGTTLLPGWVYSLVDFSAPIAILAMVPLAAAAVVVRFRRAVGEQRAQMKWFASVVVLWGTGFLASWALQFFARAEFPSAVVTILAFATLVLLPISIVIAITRYHLYAIDRLITRTLVYVPLIGIVSGLYAALVVFFERILTVVTRDTSDAAAVISALIVAAVFAPIHKSIEEFVDRHFKPTAAPTKAADGRGASTITWTDSEFEAAVERIVVRTLAKHRPSHGPERR